jgi:hypothetical protein
MICCRTYKFCELCGARNGQLGNCQHVISIFKGDFYADRAARPGNLAAIKKPVATELCEL